MRLGTRYHCSSATNVATNVIHDRQARKRTTRKRWKWSDVRKSIGGSVSISPVALFGLLSLFLSPLAILLPLLLPPLSLSGTASWCWFFIALGFFISVAG